MAGDTLAFSIPVPKQREYMPKAKGTIALPLARTEGTDEMTRMMQAIPMTTAPMYIVVNRPKYTSATQPPRRGKP